MRWIKRTFGIDGIDLSIHAGVTIAVMTVLGQFISHGAAVAMLAAVGGTSLGVLGIRRHRALRQLPPETSGQFGAERLAEIDERLAVLEQGERRLYELEERLDFAERLLAQAREPERLT
ncbi:MAG TPA: hypothetical protein PKA66_07675 [Gemmatimonadales bacterium]|nr:hypothetical protein [Gemmatimonadales bacterium]